MQRSILINTFFLILFFGAVNYSVAAQDYFLQTEALPLEVVATNKSNKIITPIPTSVKNKPETLPTMMMLEGSVLGVRESYPGSAIDTNKNHYSNTAFLVFSFLLVWISTYLFLKRKLGRSGLS